MAKVIVYSTDYCPFCDAAKNLLRQKDVDFEEIDVSGDPQARAALVEKANGMRTVPQIFINEEHIGGFDELSGLDREGKLDPLLDAN